MAYSKEDRERAEAQFHKTLKATKARKQGKSQYEAEERAVREKTARLKALRLAKEATTKPSEPAPKIPSLPNAKELVSLRIDRDVLEHFQEAGPGWQDRINEALRKVAGK